ncbi:MAG: phosphoenolpyruvate carboxylase, partial [Actinobacteria bacterium]|nr:phosphoenolpyruvate carboxylase [Actinomycetota bacterium]
LLGVEGAVWRSGRPLPFEGQAADVHGNLDTLARGTPLEAPWKDQAARQLDAMTVEEWLVADAGPRGIEYGRGLVRAILAVEAQRFYEHGGVDFVRVAGAGVNNILAGRIEQGGSTLTQQLARMAFLTPDKAYRRKMQEMVLATRLERSFTKDAILELYLNKAYFGNGLYGVEAASLGYFGKHAADLDVAEAALVAGLVKSPSNYAPTTNAERAIARRNPFIDPLSFVQLELLRRLRAPGGDPDDPELVRASLLAINGIAGGLRNTG